MTTSWSVNLLSLKPQAIDVPIQCRLPEAQLVERSRTGDGAAFEELYRRYLSRVGALLRRMVGSLDVAEELTQETFIRAWRGLACFDGRSSFHTWLFRVATNTALTWRRGRARSRVVPYGSAMRLHPESRPWADPALHAEQDGMLRRVSDALRHLPEAHRVPLLLGPIFGLDYRRVAQVLGTTSKTLKGRLHRARENLRAILHSA